MSGIRDLGKIWGLQQKAFGQIGDVDQVGPDLGWDIAKFQEKFPNYYDFLSGLIDPVWTNADMLNRTYFTCCYMETALSYNGIDDAWVNGQYEGRMPIQIPAGRWYINSDLRSGQHKNIGAGSAYNYEQGGTEIHILDTDWKSHHGTQNDGVRIGFYCWNYGGENNDTPYPYRIGWGGEWSHDFSIENMRIVGTAGNVWSGTKIEIGVMSFVPGEEHVIRDCRFDDLDGFGVLISHNPAPFRMYNNSFFHNAIGGVGIRGCAESSILLDACSGDYNPYMVFMFRGGKDYGYGTGPLLDHWLGNNPGGSVTMISPKIEAFCCRNGYDSMTTCTPDRWGKGQSLAHLTGRFYFSVYGGQQYCHEGKVDSMIRVVEDDPAFGLDNSSILVSQLYTKQVAHVIHDTKNNKKWVGNPNHSFTHDTSFYWRNDYDSGRVRNPYTQEYLTDVTATYDGRQPFIANSQGYVWNHNAAPTFNYNNITGVDYP